jgi:hypothetical protein
VSYTPHHRLLEQVEREERDARLRLAAAREQAQDDAPHEHHELLHKLEAEWKQALGRLHHARKGAQD